ncbi:hypothetical protein J6590_084784 [Homalodisca vitripennis]|nr:hypothetical protein J6590_084784 [Homalodisca vitripennis]
MDRCGQTDRQKLNFTSSSSDSTITLKNLVKCAISSRIVKKNIVKTVYTLQHNLNSLKYKYIALCKALHTPFLSDAAIIFFNALDTKINVDVVQLEFSITPFQSKTSSPGA